MAKTEMRRDAVAALEETGAALGGLKWSVATTYELSLGYIDNLVEVGDLSLGENLLLWGKAPSASRTNSACYTQTAIASARHRIHGKVILGSGPNGVLLAIGSANLTSEGLGGGNLEIQRVILNPPSQLVHGAAQWLRRRLSLLPHRLSPRWNKKLAGLESVSTGALDSSGAAWIDNDEICIADKIKRLLGRRQVNRLTVVSPYVGGLAIERLTKQFHLRRASIDVVIPSKFHHRRRILSNMEPWRMRVRQLRGEAESLRFPHAKLLIFKFANKSGLLVYGSANATEAGLYSAVTNNGPRVLAECVIAVPLNSKELQRFLQSMPFENIASDDDLEGEGLEDQSKPVEPFPLYAWYRPEVATVEIWPPAEKSLPGKAPVVKIGRHHWPLVPIAGEDLLFKLPVASQGEFEVRLRNDSRAKVVWGIWQGPIQLLEQVPLQEDSIDALWGGETAWEYGGAGGGSKGELEQEAVGVVGQAELDEYEKRSIRVCQAITRDLCGPYPSLIGTLERLWKERRNLGCIQIEGVILEGCSFFLGTRLLAAYSRFPSAPIPARALFKQIEQDVTRLRRSLFMGAKDGTHRNLERWMASIMWLEGRKLLKEARR